MSSSMGWEREPEAPPRVPVPPSHPGASICPPRHRPGAGTKAALGGRNLPSLLRVSLPQPTARSSLLPPPACTSAKEVGAGRGGNHQAQHFGHRGMALQPIGHSEWHLLSREQPCGGPGQVRPPAPPSGAPTPLCSMTREQPADLTLLQARSLEGSLRSHSKGRQRHFLPTECHRTWTRCKPGCNLRCNRLKQ